jgi:flavin prenyltransferase
MSTEPLTNTGKHDARSIALAITGASGAVYATRTMAALLERGCHLEVVVSDYGRRLLRDELGDAAAVDRLGEYLTAKYGNGVRNGTTTLYSNKDLGAKIASGSQNCAGMVIVPCSMKTLAGIRAGYADGLVGRAADVVLKERRPLVLVPRETPLSEIHLENMLDLARKGVRIVPPMPAFYNHPASVDDIVDHITARVLDQLDLPAADAKRWHGMRAARPAA